MQRKLWLLLMISLPACVCGKFVDVTEQNGITHVHVLEEDAGPGKQYPGLKLKTDYSSLAGMAAFDANGDGLTDFIAARANRTPALYINQAEGGFREESEARGLGAIPDLSAFCAADFDNDGDTDLFAVPHKGYRFYLFINDGAGNFEIADESWIAGSRSETYPHQGYSVSACDYDRDGYLDVYVCEWGVPQQEERNLHSVLLRNLGDEAPGRFENVTQQAGLVSEEANVWGMQYDYSAGWADFDEDGWPDLYVVGDLGTSRMYWNRGDGTFAEGASNAVLGAEEAGMGVAIADYDGDGMLDLFVTSIYDQFSIDRYGTMYGNKLYRNLGERRFVESAVDMHVDNAGWGWGAVFFDFNNDSRQDLLVANGMDANEGGEIVPFYDALDDQTALFIDNGNGYYQNVSSHFGISDTGFSKAAVVLDYDQDGREDLLISNTFDRPILYRNEISRNEREWIRFRLQGTVSNRDGIGALVRLFEGEKTQTKLYNPTNSYIGQREPILHFGLGKADGIVDRVEILWPSGITQTVETLETNAIYEIVEPGSGVGSGEVVVEGAGVFSVGESVTLTAKLGGEGSASYAWEKDGVVLPDRSEAELVIERMHPYDAGTYRVRALIAGEEVVSEPVELMATVNLEGKSIARLWNEFLLEAIRVDFPAPTIHSRNLYHLSAAMWDAFWAYEPDIRDKARPAFVCAEPPQSISDSERVAAQREAISYASYRVLKARYENSVSGERILYNLRWLMENLGYDPDYTTIEGATPAATGNRIAASVLAATIEDGSNEANGYVDPDGYESVNEPLVYKRPGAEMDNPNRWQPLAFDWLVTQNGIVIGADVQDFVGANWRDVKTFAIDKPTPSTIAWDPGPPPQFGEEGHDSFVAAAVEVIRFSSYLDASSEEIIDISPGARLNNPLGSNEGTGRAVNPFTGDPYAPNLVNHADYGRLLAEFWADGPASETPPGHWNTILNEVADQPEFQRRYMGQGPVLSELEWDVQAYLALNGAMHDAAVAAWTLKRQYDYSRPISMIRYLSGLGQSSDPDGLSYHPLGLPLVEALIEVVTMESSAPGQRHERLASSVGKIALRCWAGAPETGGPSEGGVAWILGERWMPYQKSTFVTPAFAAYVSGHSTFSRAAAETLALLTGSPFFPGGIGRYHFEKDSALEFEKGPTEDLTLEWATYFDAADQAGLSRLYGGIHVRADDLVGRALGARIGVEAFLKAHAMRVGGEGRSDLADTLFEYEFVSGLDACFAELLFADGARRPVAALVLDNYPDGSLEEGVYVDLARENQRSQGRVFARSDQLSKARLAGRLGEDGMLLVSLTIPDGAAKLLAVRAWHGTPSQRLGSAASSEIDLRIYSLEQSGETQVAASTGRHRDSTDSVVEAIGLRTGIPKAIVDEIDTALVVALPPGTYRLEASGAEYRGIATIEVESVHYEMEGEESSQ